MLGDAKLGEIAAHFAHERQIIESRFAQHLQPKWCARRSGFFTASLRRVMNPVMNETKWDEVRLAMYRLGQLSPQWRTLDLESGYLSGWDGEWFHHFQNGGYKSIEWLELRISSSAQYDVVLDALEKVHVPGEQTEFGFKVFGYVPNGVVVDYLTRFHRPLNPTVYDVG